MPSAARGLLLFSLWELDDPHQGLPHERVLIQVRVHPTVFQIFAIPFQGRQVGLFHQTDDQVFQRQHCFGIGCAAHISLWFLLRINLIWQSAHQAGFFLPQMNGLCRPTTRLAASSGCAHIPVKVSDPFYAGRRLLFRAVSEAVLLDPCRGWSDKLHKWLTAGLFPVRGRFHSVRYPLYAAGWHSACLLLSAAFLSRL